VAFKKKNKKEEGAGSMMAVKTKKRKDDGAGNNYEAPAPGCKRES
jgi:hypothetical protein